MFVTKLSYVNKESLVTNIKKPPELTSGEYDHWAEATLATKDKSCDAPNHAPDKTAEVSNQGGRGNCSQR
jgi:hypothetical protein